VRIVPNQVEVSCSSTPLFLLGGANIAIIQRVRRQRGYLGLCSFLFFCRQHSSSWQFGVFPAHSKRANGDPRNRRHNTALCCMSSPIKLFTSSQGLEKRSSCAAFQVPMRRPASFTLGFIIFPFSGPGPCLRPRPRHLQSRNPCSIFWELNVPTSFIHPPRLFWGDIERPFFFDHNCMKLIRIHPIFFEYLIWRSATAGPQALATQSATDRASEEPCCSFSNNHGGPPPADQIMTGRKGSFR